MQLIKLSLKDKQEQWMIYTYEDDHWELQNHLLVSRRIYLYEILKHLHSSLDFAAIGLYLPYHQALYTAMPQIQIVILPEELWRFAVHASEISLQSLDEVAAGLDGGVKQAKNEMQYFIKRFYQSHSLKEAQAIYEGWQCERCLYDKASEKLLLMMNLYQDEIFNYFRYQKILDNLIK